MSRVAWFLTLAAGLVLQAGWGIAGAQDLYVIANSETGLAPAQIRDVFLGDREFAGSVRLVPVDNAQAHRLFLDRVMNMSAAGYSGAWTRKSFRDGLNRPPVKRSDFEVIEFVRHTPGAIGYVTSVPGGMAIVGKF